MEITPKGFEEARAKLTPEQLDKPVDEVDAEPTAESVPEEAVKPEAEPEKEPVEEESKEPEAKAEEEEEKVPKSRFLTMHQRAIEAEKALRQFEAERANQPEPVTPIADDEELHNFFKETFGDTELTEKLYKNELARLASIEDKAAERAFERLSQREQQEAQVIEERVASFDQAFDELTSVTGKDFSDDEQVAILDIVEEYSPKDADGKLIGDYLLPLDKAYEIYSVKNQPVVQAKKAERNKVASLSGARSEGTPAGESNADWKPGWNGEWRNKV